ncbi:MAG: molybdenum cofactor biosynthesis protein MoaE [Gammaproteobacteria bacterium]|nr:molybdenum cofactor biosynthesis protein MoaE [Gammaproteobacteria bacterium]
MLIEVRGQAFDPWQELKNYESECLAKGNYGASANFVGTMRDFNEGDAVTSMTLEHYPGMTEQHLQTIADQAKQTHNLLDVLILHRVGALQPGDPIVLVAVWSAHRAAAFDACREIMEDLKSKAPFWKKENLKDGERWIESNTPG